MAQVVKVVELAGRFGYSSEAEINMSKSDGAWLGEFVYEHRHFSGVN